MILHDWMCLTKFLLENTNCELVNLIGSVLCTFSIALLNDNMMNYVKFEFWLVLNKEAEYD